MNLLKFQRFTILHGYRFIALFCGLQALYIEVVFHIYIYPTIHNKSTFMTNNISPSTTNQQSWLTISHHPQQINSHDWQYPNIHNKSTVMTDNISPSITNQQSWLTISHHPQQINSHDWQYLTIYNTNNSHDWQYLTIYNTNKYTANTERHYINKNLYSMDIFILSCNKNVLTYFS